MADGKPRVLIADDEAHVRAYIKALITGLDCEVVAEAHDGAQAVALYREHRPDLLLLDINMPRKTGIEAVREIAGEFEDANIVMLSSVANLKDIETCLDEGASNYVRKDCSPNEIREIVKDALDLD